MTISATAHTPGVIYPAGTRYSNSTYDEATDELTHGWQVFIQKFPDGTPTGRRSFMNNRGILCVESIAKQERERATRDAAPELLAALESFIRAPGVGSNGPGSSTIAVQEFNLLAARAAIAKAAGAAS